MAKIPVTPELDNGFGIGSRQIFTSSGTYTKPAGLKAVVVELVGGEGAGGGTVATGAGQSSAGAGGGGGGYSKKFILAEDLASSETVTVGSGGSAVSGADGNAGGASSFGSHCTGNGGSGGSTITSVSGRRAQGGANGGSSTGGDINIRGGASEGTWKLTATNADMSFGSAGGTAGGFGGGNGRGVPVPSTSFASGQNGTSYGGAGSGASSGENNAAQIGGSGFQGVVIVWDRDWETK